MEETRMNGADAPERRVIVPRTGGTLRDKGALLERVADHDQASRKRFLKLVGGAGAVGALGTLLAACGGDEEETTAAQTAPEDQSPDEEEILDVFNYALTLEYLEAKFYQDVIDSGVIKDPMLGQVAQTFGEHEQEHVDALVATIEQMGGTPVDDPNGNFQDVIDGGPKMVLTVAARVENVGAAAYLNEAPKLIDSDEALAAALSIHTVEGRHAAALNEVAGFGFTGKDQFEGTIPDGAFATPADRDTVMQEIQPFLAGGGGGGGGNSGGGN
jgi:hypothetical protein